MSELSRNHRSNPEILQRLLAEPGVAERVRAKLARERTAEGLDPRAALPELRAAGPADLSSEIDRLPWEQKVEMEAIVRLTGRPVLTVHTDWVTPEEAEGEWIAKLKTPGDARDRVRSIGRVEVTDHPDFTWLGTAFVIAENVVVTNRHVAEEFARRAQNGWEPRTFGGVPVQSAIDFRREARAHPKGPAIFSVDKILYVAESGEPDVAFLQVKWQGAALPPIPLGDSVRESEDVIVVGHPAFDSRTRLPRDQRRIFQGLYDVKRLAPGRVMRTNLPEGVFSHDCSTLGGNSGSAVVSLESGKAVGLHFAGTELSANYAVSAQTLAALRDRVLGRVSITPGASFTPPPPATTSSSSLSAPQPPPPSSGPRIEMVSRQCKLEPYDRLPRPRPIEVTGQCIAFASPDSTFAVTREAFDRANESILIGIYDFSAPHVESLVLDAVGRGVKVSVMLDVDSKAETELMTRLRKRGVECVDAPSCASQRAHYFHSSHEKVIVIDDAWSFVQSGNYSTRSIPANLAEDRSEPFRIGNRDCGVLIESKQLAAYFTRVLRRDMALELGTEGLLEALAAAAPERPEILVERPEKPAKRFSRGNFTLNNTKVTPVLTPENYMSEVTALLRSAKSSILLEQQYIRTGHEPIQQLLEAIVDARERNPDLDVRIILAPPIGDARKTARELEAIKDLEDYGLRMKTNVRLLNPRYFSHCHNKLIVVDGRAVLVGSQNWSRTAVLTNREASLLIPDAGVAGYFARIFEADWADMSLLDPMSFRRKTPGNQEAVSAGAWTPVDAADFDEV